MLLVQIADLRRKTARPQLQAPGQGTGLKPQILELRLELPLVRVDGHYALRIEHTAQRAASDDVAVPQTQALVALAERQCLRGGSGVEYRAELPAAELRNCGCRGCADREQYRCGCADAVHRSIPTQVMAEATKPSSRRCLSSREALSMMSS